MRWEGYNRPRPTTDLEGCVRRSWFLILDDAVPLRFTRGVILVDAYRIRPLVLVPTFLFVRHTVYEFARQNMRYTRGQPGRWSRHKRLSTTLNRLLGSSGNDNSTEDLSETSRPERDQIFSHLSHTCNDADTTEFLDKVRLRDGDRQARYVDPIVVAVIAAVLPAE